VDQRKDFTFGTQMTGRS